MSTYPRERWICPICTASCTFEAMQWCAKREGSSECGYDDEQPEALGGAFEFVAPLTVPSG